MRSAAHTTLPSANRNHAHPPTLKENSSSSSSSLDRARKGSSCRPACMPSCVQQVPVTSTLTSTGTCATQVPHAGRHGYTGGLLTTGAWVRPATSEGSAQSAPATTTTTSAARSESTLLSRAWMRVAPTSLILKQ